MPKVTFLPVNKTISTRTGKDLLTLSREASVFIPTACAGEGVCGLCRVRIVKGEVDSELAAVLSPKDLEQGFKLACRSFMKNEDVIVEVPRRAQVYHFKIKSSIEEIEQKFLTRPKFKPEPLIEKRYFSVPKPSLTDALSDCERVLTQLHKKAQDERCGNYEISLSNIRILPRLLREADFKITTVLLKTGLKTELISCEAGDSSKKNFAVAVDIGTTTVSAQLINLNNAGVLLTQAAFNKQLKWGEDVITRILHASEERGREELHQAVAGNVNELIESLACEKGISAADINIVSCAGNTTMMHLLLNIDPANIRKEPYVPVVNDVLIVKAAECSININPKGVLLCLPSVSSYVGADICAGVLSCGLDKEKEVNLLIDIGTNGEIALGNKDWLMCCAASAGPAFEGSGTACGMKAAAGAIQKVKINKNKRGALDISCETVKNETPRGICGSGYIDLLAELFKNKIINRSGNLLDTCEKVEKKNGILCFVVYKDDSGRGEDVYISQEDIYNLKRSKAAIYAAFCTLLKKVNLSFENIKKIYIAGGFGRFLNIRNSVIIGLLPDLKEDVFEFAGNSSLSGAKEVLLSREAFEDVKKIRRMMTYVELSAENTYMEEYTKALFFPHTEIERFKTV